MHKCLHRFEFMTPPSSKMPKSITFSTPPTSPKPAQSIYAQPQKRPRMSITQTYFLAHSARGKLSKEAARPDHDLRLLVGHANMLDSLMLDLANAEQEQERWLNRTFSDSDKEEEEEKTVDHIETVAEDEEDHEDDEEEQDEEEKAEEEQAPVHETFQLTEAEPESDDEDVEEEEEEEEDDDHDEENTLTRTVSHHSPPLLSQDFDSDSEDEETNLPSPSQPNMPVLSEKERQSIATTSYYDTNEASIFAPVESETFQQEGFYLPSRQPSVQIAAY